MRSWSKVIHAGLALMLVASLWAATASASYSSPALFVVDSTPLNSDDTAIKNELVSLGFGVTVVASSTVSSSDANGKQLVFISPSAASGSVNTKFRTSTVPVVTAKPYLYDDMGMTGTVATTDYGNEPSITQVQMVSASADHPLAANLSGTVTVLTAATGSGWGKPNANAAKIATVIGNANESLIFAYEKGAQMPGLAAPARRVGFMLTSGTASSFNSNGWLLFDAAVKWSAGVPQFNLPGVNKGSSSSLDPIHEASGLGASRTNANVLWTENDSGDTARVFAINTSAQILGIYNFQGATAVDWEDMDIGPGPNGANYLYMGDIGDNPENRDGTSRDRIAVYRAPEPTVSNADNPPPPDQAPEHNITDWQKITLKYPDGEHNCEAMMIDPISGDLYLIIKHSISPDPAKTARVYKATAAQLNTGATNGTVVTMTKIATVTSIDQSTKNVGLTAADISPDGSYIVMKNLQEAFVWSRFPGETVDQALNRRTGDEIPLAIDQTGVIGNGEAVAAAADNGGFYTTAEGASAKLGYFSRK